VKWKPKWPQIVLPAWSKKASNFEVLKTFCGEVAVLVLVFPLLDWYLSPSDPGRWHELKIIRWTPLLALVFLGLAIVSAQMEKKFEDIEEGGKH